MKNLIFIAAFIMIAGLAHGQSFQKGNFVGIHVYTIDLDPDVTMNQFLEVWKNKFNPVYEKNLQAKVYILKGIRGECENCFGSMMVWESEKDRDKFFTDEGELNEVGQAAVEKMQAARDELTKLGKITSKYTDWIVQ